MITIVQNATETLTNQLPAGVVEVPFPRKLMNTARTGREKLIRVALRKLKAPLTLPLLRKLSF
jgi:hypothetical protein